VALAIQQIRGTLADDELLDLLLNELRELFPPEVRSDPIIFLSRLQNSPAGLRAMAATYDLDVSMALDDLAWHFINHHGLIDFAEEAVLGLRELEAAEAADIFQEALNIIKPYWNELEAVARSKSPHDWLNAKGIQKMCDPLNSRMWNVLKALPRNSLFDYWIVYARKYPERCVTLDRDDE
jgi:hypothetical protein